MELPNEKELSEWYEHPVTSYLSEILNDRIQMCVDNKAGIYYEGEPFKTQEHIARLGGAFDELALMAECIKDKEIEEFDPDFLEVDDE